MTHEFRYARRQAFTLVEMLAVIAIIAILAALAAYGVFAMVGNQKANNTNATIKVVNKVLQSHWQKVIEDAKNDPLISPAVVGLANNGTAANLDPTGERAKVLWVKFRLMEAFPQSFGDITNPVVYNSTYTDPHGINYGPYIPANQSRYIAAYQKNLPALPASHNTTTESAACLLMALSVNRGGIVLNADQIGYAVADADSDGVKELVDAWSPRQPPAPAPAWLQTAPPVVSLVPLVFTRFDYGINANTGANVQSANPAAAGAKTAKFADPVDPDGTLLNNAWYASAARPIFEGLVNYKIETATGSGAANYVIPSIVSAGKDGVFGTQDDIISYNLR